MNEREHELMETELHRLKPAKPPTELMDRLWAAVPATPTPHPRARDRQLSEWWLPWLRWLAPISAVGLVAFVSIRQIPWAVSHSGEFNADDVQINHKLVSSFDAVGELPGGEPVRFRVREWSDSTVLHDSARGLVMEQNTPRLEVVPVAFETY
jgi:hypothetical protein